MSEEIVNTEIKVPKEVIETLKYYTDQTEVSVDDFITSMLTDGYTVAHLGESVVRLEGVNPWTIEEELDPVGEDGEETEKTIKTYRELREGFPPVSAGIDYPKSFTSATGFDVKIDEPDESYQVESKGIIENFNRRVFMDEFTIGLDVILDIMIDTTFTDGLAAAEIVYDGWDDNNMKFEDWAIPREATEKHPAKWKPIEMKDSDWKKLGGIKQLKIINNAYHRLKPYRDPVSWNVLYWTVDEKTTADDKQPKKLLPWQVFSLSWNRRENRIKGVSHIKPVAETAVLLRKILADIGVSINKWSDKKYFFILGDEKTGRTWSPHHVRNFSSDMKKMVDKNGTGMPVPAGFDIRSIGGEGGVYDGGKIIDYLLTMIVNGMKYPRAFLEQRNSGEDDKAWLGWLVTYSRDQTQLRRAVENQLWMRHLYCKKGMLRRDSKKGVPIEKQELIPIYVPIMEWSSEGKWHQETKLKMLKTLLDSANPVIPELKTQIERDMAKTLGYSETRFDDADKAVEKNREIDLLEKEIELMKRQMEKELIEQFYENGEHLLMIPIIRFASTPEPEFDESTEEGDTDDSGMSEEEKEAREQGAEKRPAPMPQKRLKGGVHRSTRDTLNPNERGIAKPQGTTRQPTKTPKTTREEKT
jgi:hypothetical protein